MAEERLIDDDKDRKYKIVKNADGEDELVIDTDPVEEEVEEPVFEVEESEFDDEEAAVMTPEQLAAREKAREEAEAKRVADLKAHISHAQTLIDGGKFDDALFVLDAADALERGNGAVCALKLVALTRGFTDFSLTAEAEEAAESVKTFADDATKAELKERAGDLSARVSGAREAVEKLGAENEAGKSARREKFLLKRKKAAVCFGVTAAPLAVFAVLAICFGSVMHSQLDDTFMILCFVFSGLAAAAFIATVFTARALWASANLVKRNEKNSSTKLGREFEAASAKLKLLEKLDVILREVKNLPDQADPS